MRPKTLLLLVVAIACGLVAAFMVNQISGTQRAENMVNILVPNKDLPGGTKIDVKKDFHLKPFPRDSISLKVIQDEAKLHNKVVARTVYANQCIMERDLFTDGNIFKELEPGYRAMTVKATIETANHGFLPPGARVDLMTVLKDTKDNNKSESKIFMQNVKVLAVNTLYEQQPEKANVANPVSVTLMVTAEQAERLYWVSSRSTVGMVLRKPGDAKEENTKGARGPVASDKTSAAAGDKSVTVYVATRDVPEGVKIGAVDDYFSVVTYQQGQVFGQVITDRSELENKTVTRFIAAGQPATKLNFVAFGIDPAVSSPASIRPWRMTIISGGQAQVFESGTSASANTPPGEAKDN